MWWVVCWGRHHGHVTGKYRAFVDKDCNINLMLTKEVMLIFYNLRDYEKHLIM